MAELAKPGKTILLERSGTLIAEHAAPAAPASMDYPNERAALAIFRKRVTELVINGWQLSRGDTDIGSPSRWSHGSSALSASSSIPSSSRSTTTG